MNARERLVEAAQDLLWERGYVGTSPKAIQDRAGAGQGSMYHHFTGKADLARTALQRTADRERAGAEALLGGTGTALERLTAYLQRERQVMRGCPVGRHAQDPDLVADAALRAPVETTFAWLRARLAEVVAEGQAAGELRADADPAAVAAAVVATVQGGYVLARAAGRPEPFDEAVEGAVALLGALAR
ncbi:TetR/AcrR family transcriptional regulator [Geodermatophilus nigrescens]|uniref:Transcriptional regulator, TetR family n=1 Tax=Geodermatophilus nigrescens TaxID=1070870 RepID=A0A1M5FQU2_9ACTN|nr:TetR/AcrR family transcriptional regulator [Geodermatophilus nigrescens]SHF93878.1 transcriptional regulator, TetR family [Geodermatophilus nigrescens]